MALVAAAHSIKRKPISHITIVDEPVIKTLSHRLHAYSSFDLVFSIHDGQQKIRLALEPNHDVLDEDFAITHLNEDGSVREVVAVPRTDDKVYRGTAFIEREGISGWSKAGWARVSIHQDGERPIFDGVFRVDGDNHHILPRADYQAMKDEQDPAVDPVIDRDDLMVVWRDSDVVDDNGIRTELKRDVADLATCNADTLDFNKAFRRDVDEDSLSLRSMGFGSLFGRQIDDGGGSTGLNLISSIGSTSGCPTTKKVALVGIVTDCNYFAAYNDTNAIKKQIISNVNKASAIYEDTFKISLAIRNMTIIDRGCTGTVPANTPWNVKCSDDITLSDRLNTFSKWRGELQDDNAYWTLFTTCPTQSAVGLAWRGMVCRTGASTSGGGGGDNETVAATNVVVKADTEWQIFAHESGHTFGAVHDCAGQACPAGSTSGSCCPLSSSQCDAGGKYIMNPSTGNGITQFSPCSIGNICAGFKSNMVKSNCFKDNKNVQTDVDIGSQCGNGIVEAGEECDCGGVDGCKGNSCCDAQTCKFTSGSVCDPSNEDCCTDQCKFASSGTVCRPSTGECDVEETCPGDKAACPDDKYKDNGDSCGSGGLQCASGQCTSRDLQCQHMANSLTGRNNTKACPDSVCMLACTSPDLPSNQCVTYNQNFVDGTSCGAGGHCVNGQCEGSSTAKEIGQWIQDHKPIFIPIAVVVGLVILAGLFSCVKSCVRRRRGATRVKKQPSMNSWPSSSFSGRQGQWTGQQPPMQQQQQWNGPPQYPEASGALFDDSHQHQGVYGQPPAYPPPPIANRGRSARYM